MYNSYSDDGQRQCEAGAQIKYTQWARLCVVLGFKRLLSPPLQHWGKTD